MPNRCEWAGQDPLMIAYHDHEWGQPLHDEQRLFEFLTLEGAQAGLSWMTILKKRENFRRALAVGDRYGMWLSAYASYKYSQVYTTPEISSARFMAFSTRLAVDVLYNMNYYFETIGDFEKAEEALHMKETIQHNFRNMIKLVNISKPQFN